MDEEHKVLQLLAALQTCIDNVRQDVAQQDTSLTVSELISKVKWKLLTTHMSVAMQWYTKLTTNSEEVAQRLATLFQSSDPCRKALWTCIKQAADLVSAMSLVEYAFDTKATVTKMLEEPLQGKSVQSVIQMIGDWAVQHELHTLATPKAAPAKKATKTIAKPTRRSSRVKKQSK